MTKRVLKAWLDLVPSLVVLIACAALLFGVAIPFATEVVLAGSGFLFGRSMYHLIRGYRIRKRCKALLNEQLARIQKAGQS